MARPLRSVWDDLAVSYNLNLSIGLVLVFSIFVNLLILTSPIYMMQVYDRVLGTGQIETLIYLSIIAALALATLGLLEGVRSFLLTRLGHMLDLLLRDPVLTQSIVQSRSPRFERRRLVEDFGTARNYLGSPAVLPFLDAPWVPFFVLIIATIHPWLGILALVSAIVLFLLALANDFATRRAIQQSGAKAQQANDFAQAAILNAEVVNAMGMQKAVSRRYRHHVEQSGMLAQNAADISAVISSMSKAIRIAVQSAALGLGALLVIRGELTSGGMIASSIVLGRALAPIEQVIGSWKQFAAARESYGNLKRFFKALPKESEAIALPGLKGRLSVEEVAFQLPDAPTPAVRRATFAMEPGTALALVGPSASGKTTLCRMLVGAIAPSRGNVRLDGADVITLNPDDTSRVIGYMPQNVELFSGTVRDNIARLGDNNDEATVAAAKAAGCHEMILRLPNGYDTELGPRGAFLSGGQRQRIGLARALYGSPRLVVLDEPNSNLDQDGETALVEAIARAKQAGTTVVVVSHRSTLLQPIDKLGIMRDGVLERFGDRDEVLREMAANAPQRKPTLVPVGETQAAGTTGGAS